EAAALEIGADEDRVFAGLVIGIGVQPHYPHHLAAFHIERDEGDGARVVDLHEPGEKRVTELADRSEEAQAQIRRAYMLEELEHEALILRPDRAHKEAPPVLELHCALPL